LSDRFVVELAIAAVFGAWLARPVPGLAVAVVVAVALVWRRPSTALVAVVVVASVLGARAWSGLDPVDRGPFAGVVTLGSDPENVAGAVRVEVRDGGRRLEAWTRGAGAGRVRDLLAGERVHLRGRVGPPPANAPWLVPRHVRGRLEVDAVGATAAGHPVTRLANGLRRTLHAGAADLSGPHRALFSGLVLGDDREQDPVTTDDFRGAGLSHLLAVSGQNVAFVLALAAPVTARLGWRGRWFAVLAVLAFFALITRFEPSVVRATVMAALATTAVAWGREASSHRLLAMAVGGLVVIDPLLVQSVGFRLSVGASAGIAVLSRPLVDRLRGPLAVRSALAVTIAAQLGVAPILIPVFGGVPVASIPANLLAGWAAGPVMVGGLTAGLVAGLVGGRTASALHLPTEVLVGWIAAVARWSSGLRLGEWGGGHVAVLVLAGGCWSWCRSRSRAGVAVLALIAVAVAFHPAAVLRVGPSPRQVAVAPGATLYAASVLVIDGDVAPARMLEGLRRQGADRPDLVAATSGGARAAEAVALVQARYGPVPVVAPRHHRVRGAVAPAPPWALSVDGLRVTGRVAESGAGLDIRVDE
jgi:competence protein ComEC